MSGPYTYRWQKASATYISRNPYCVMCKARGVDALATVVDHIVPHKGRMDLFWDSRKNWQGLCKACHDGAKKAQENSGRVRGCDADGVPLDSGHEWRRK